jgi:nucleoid-associated protein YgaU
MGLFDFTSNIGRKLFGNEDQAATKITEHLEANNPGIEGLSVDYQDGVVTVSGEAADSEAVEKAILMAGNVEGVKEVINNTSVPIVEEIKVEYYVIQSGDTLSKLAKKYYGDAMAYNRIFEANREVIQDPDLIFVGQKIRIPLD